MSPFTLDAISFPQDLVALIASSLSGTKRPKLILSISRATALESVLSPRSLGSFGGKWCFKEHSHLKSPSLWKQGNKQFLSSLVRSFLEQQGEETGGAAKQPRCVQDFGLWLALPERTMEKSPEKPSPAAFASFPLSNRPRAGRCEASVFLRPGSSADQADV